MNTFVLHLESATHYDRIEQVVSFVGHDRSGSFGLLPGHARMLTLLGFGLARFRVAAAEWQFLAVPGAVASFADNQLHLSTRRYVCGPDFERITAALREELAAEEEALRATRQSVKQLEEEMFRRLWKLRRGMEL